MRIETGLTIFGQGAVSPAGPGVAALLEPAAWKTSRLSAVRNGSGEYDVYRVDLDYASLAKWREHARFRRASPISLFMAEAARQALDAEPKVPSERLGIVAALSSGCIAYSRRFFQGAIQEGRRFASPLLFPETVFNAPISHLAAALNAGGPCYSLVGDESAWVSAIRTAACWLKSGQADRVLVVGAEELDPVTLEAFRAAHWLRAGASFVPAEGAGAMLLGRKTPGPLPEIRAVSAGAAYQSRRDAGRAASSCLADFEPAGGVHLSSGESWMKPVESEWVTRTGRRPVGSFPYCGEAFAASAAWHTLRAVSSLDSGGSQVLVPFWGLHEQVSALQLARG